MNPINSHEDLEDTDSRRVWSNIIQIMQLASDSAAGGSGTSHRIYTLARDCRDLLLFDQNSRETMRRLLVNPGTVTVMGLDFPVKVQDWARDNRKIEAIKELRLHTGCGLKEAKDAVEQWMTQNGLSW
jgi:hypothetical protein